MKQELGLRTKALATTEQQRDDALAKAATTATNSQRQRKVLKALREANASMDDKINAAKTSLCKEKEHHGATKDALQLAEWKIAVLTGSLAEASKDRKQGTGHQGHRVPACHKTTTRTEDPRKIKILTRPVLGVIPIREHIPDK